MKSPLRRYLYNLNSFYGKEKTIHLFIKSDTMKFTVPQPCHEDWNKMLPEQKGAFCNACSKVVVDFSKMTDEQLITYFEKHKEEKLCGRFKSSQLTTVSTHKFKLSEAKITNGFKGAFLVSCFAAFTTLFTLTGCDNYVNGEPLIINDLVDTATLVIPADTISAVDLPAIDTVKDLEITMGKPAIIHTPEDTVKVVQDTITPIPDLPDYPIMGIMVPIEPLEIEKP
jgi:hypothetical protein